MGCQSSKQKINVFKPNGETQTNYAAIRFQNKYHSDWTEDHSRTKEKIIEKYNNVSPSSYGRHLHVIHEESSSVISSKMYIDFEKENQNPVVKTSPKKKIGKVL